MPDTTRPDKDLLDIIAGGFYPQPGSRSDFGALVRAPENGSRTAKVSLGQGEERRATLTSVKELAVLGRIRSAGIACRPDCG